MGIYIGAGLAIGLAGLGVGIGQGVLTNRSIQLIVKNPDLSGTFLVNTILGIALVESAGIYGLIVAFKIIGISPDVGISTAKVISAGLAIGLAGLGAGVGEGYLVAGALDSIFRNPAIKGRIMTYMVLFLALVEAVAIYGLIIALQLLKV